MDQPVTREYIRLVLKDVLESVHNNNQGFQRIGGGISPINASDILVVPRLGVGGAPQGDSNRIEVLCDADKYIGLTLRQNMSMTPFLPAVIEFRRGDEDLAALGTAMPIGRIAFWGQSTAALNSQVETVRIQVETAEAWSSTVVGSVLTIEMEAIGVAIGSGSEWPVLTLKGADKAATIFQGTDDNTAKTVLALRRMRHSASVPSAAGFGGDLLWELEGNSNGNAVDAALIRAYWENSQSNGTTDRDTSLAFHTMLDNSLREVARLTSAGTLVVGDVSGTGSIDIRGTATISYERAATSGAGFIFYSHRGTIASPSDSQANDTSGRILACFRQSSQRFTAELRAEVMSIASDNNPTDWVFLTGSASLAYTEKVRIPSVGGLVIGTAALATSATDGFLYLPSCAGAPSGTPTARTGRVPMVYDTTNNHLYVYNGAWKKVALA